MKIQEIRKLVETTDVNKANEWLDQGYWVVRIFPSQTATPDGKYKDSVIYVLGSKECQ